MVSPADTRRAFGYGLVGVLCFSLTLPASRVAVRQLDPVFVGLGRALVAALLAALSLGVARAPLPRGRQWPRLLLVAAGIVVGFPLLSTTAMKHVDASHGAVLTGLLPLATALFGFVLAGERPRPVFWLATVIGGATIAIFALRADTRGFQAADLLLLGAMLSAAFGYAEGARLARELGAWQTICWALLVAAPFLAWPVWRHAPRELGSLAPVTWLAFGYVSVFSMFLGFFAWYQGLALGGIARVGQLQLLQPFMTLVASAALLGERLGGGHWIAAGVVVGSIALARHAPAAAKIR